VPDRSLLARSCLLYTVYVRNPDVERLVVAGLQGRRGALPRQLCGRAAADLHPLHAGGQAAFRAHQRPRGRGLDWRLPVSGVLLSHCVLG
jgi:hypothetical protein